MLICSKYWKQPNNSFAQELGDSGLWRSQSWSSNFVEVDSRAGPFALKIRPTLGQQQ